MDEGRLAFGMPGGVFPEVWASITVRRGKERGHTMGTPILRPSNRPSERPVSLRLDSSSISRACARVGAEAQVASFASGLEMTSARISTSHRTGLTQNLPNTNRVSSTFLASTPTQSRESAYETTPYLFLHWLLSSDVSSGSDVPTDHSVTRLQTYYPAI